ncbi:AAA family ATPase, partial [Lactococcus petauri]|uniref:AAA family ATPase n=1 Tax=Lactococcus petauri TaxID=1940789 RepID=UPI0021F239A2
MTTDFTQIQAGDLIKANGGYLVIKVEDLFKYHAFMWDKFKTIIKNQKTTLSSRSYKDIIINNTLTTEPVE